MRMWRALVGMRDSSDVDIVELSEEEGGAGSLAPRTSTDVDVAYQVVAEEMG